MNAGEPPDETEEKADRSTDDESGDAGPDGDVAESPNDEVVDGTDGDSLDPAEEVEAAVENVRGAGGLEDESHDTDGEALDESAAAEAAHELAESVGTAESAGTGTADSAADGDPANAASAAPSNASSAGESQAGVAGTGPGEEVPADSESATDDDSRQAVPEDVRKYDRFKKIDGGTYDRANEFLRDRTYITAREWAMARLCADFRTETGVEMTKIGNNLPELVPFMTDTYTPQAVNQARAAFEEKVRKAGATFLYGAMCDFFTAEELDDVMYEATEVAKFLLEVEGVELSVDEELAAEDHISEVMRDVREHSAALRHDQVECPDCGHHFEVTAGEE